MRSLVSRIGLSRAGIQFVWAATRVEGFGAATIKDAPRGCARRSTPACEPRAAALAVAPFARLELAREGRASADPTTDTGCRHRKSRAPSFFRKAVRCRVFNQVWFVNSLQIGKCSLINLDLHT